MPTPVSTAETARLPVPISVWWPDPLRFAVTASEPVPVMGAGPLAVSTVNVGVATIARPPASALAGIDAVMVSCAVML
jgi:hypothetical protein